LRAFKFLRDFKPENKGRVCISGSGRAGTTFLIHLLTELGQDTGFQGINDPSYYPAARAGLEKNLFDPEGPTVIKSPFLCDHVDDVLAKGIAIRHVIIPVRDFASAAKSRQHVQIETTGSVDGPPVAGGLWDTDRASDQVAVLEHKFAKLVEGLTRHDIPMTFVSFPRITVDENYLFSKLTPIFPSLRPKRFYVAFGKIARPDLVHDFTAAGYSTAVVESGPA
jgi:hypothetical protein